MRKLKDSGVEWIGKIPIDWNIKRIKAVLCERNESNNPIQTDKILSLTNDRGVIPYDEKGDVGNKSKEDLTGYKLAYPGDIVLNSMNVFIGSVGLSSYFGCVSPVYYMLYPRNKNHSVSFFNYLFQTKELQAKLHGYGNGIMEIRMRIQMSKLNSVQLPVPPSDVQQRIAAYLDRKCSQIDAIITRQQEMIERLKSYKLSKINEIIIEVEGVTAHLGYVANMKNGLNFNMATDGKTLKFLGVGDFKDYYVLDSEEMFSDILIDTEIDSDYMIQSGDIVFVRSNGSKELVGRAVMVENVTFPLSYSGFCIRLRNLRTDILNSKYLLYFFRSPYFRKQLEKYSQGSNITNINQVILSQIPIIIPPVEVQLKAIRKVEKMLAAIDKLIKGKQEIISSLERYKEIPYL